MHQPKVRCSFPSSQPYCWLSSSESLFLPLIFTADAQNRAIDAYVQLPSGNYKWYEEWLVFTWLIIYLIIDLPENIHCTLVLGRKSDVGFSRKQNGERDSHQMGVACVHLEKDREVLLDSNKSNVRERECMRFPGEHLHRLTGKDFFHSLELHFLLCKMRYLNELFSKMLSLYIGLSYFKSSLGGSLFHCPDAVTNHPKQNRTS